MTSKKEVYEALDGLDERGRQELRELVPGKSIEDSMHKSLAASAEASANAAPGVQRGVSRRQVLAGLGASALIAPFLGSSNFMRSRAKAQTTQQPVDNILFVVWPCGMEPRWDPVGTGAGYQLGSPGPGAAPYGNEPQLKSLVDRHRADLLILSGMTGLIDPPLLSHSQGPTSLWTGWSNGGQNTKAVSGLPSIDQIIRDKISTGLAFKSLHAGTLVGVRETAPSRISLQYHFYSAPNQGIEAQNDPGVLYSDIAPFLATGAAMGGSGGTAMMTDALANKRRSVIDFITGELDGVKNRVSRDDAIKLDQHLAHVRLLEQRLFQQAGMPGSEPAATTAMCDTSLGMPNVGLTGTQARKRANGPALAKAQAEIIALAFNCGLTKVATLQLAESDCMYTVPYPGATAPMHLASHDMGNSADNVTRWVSTRYMMDRVGDILDVLKQRGAFENTLVVMTSEMSIQEHGDNDFPYFIAGGRGGAFNWKRGQHLKLSAQYHITKMILTVLEYYGIKQDRIGTYAGPGDYMGSLMEVRS